MMRIYDVYDFVTTIVGGEKEKLCKLGEIKFTEKGEENVEKNLGNKTIFDKLMYHLH